MARLLTRARGRRTRGGHLPAGASGPIRACQGRSPGEGGGWYAWWMIARPAARAEVIYLVGAVALWAPLIALHPAFLWLGFGVLAPLCLHDLRHGAAVVLVVAAGLLWQLAHQQGG